MDASNEEVDLPQGEADQRNGRLIISGPNDREFTNALHAWPEPQPLEFHSSDGANDRIVLNGVARTEHPDEWKFFGVRIDDKGQELGRSVGRYSPDRQSGFIKDYEEHPTEEPHE